MSDDTPPPGGKKPMWPGFLIGALGVAPAAWFLSMLGAPAVAPIGLITVVVAFALLFMRDPMLRGIGAGVLAAGAAAVLVLFIACYQYLQDH
jgi:hypothetical protein